MNSPGRALGHEHSKCSSFGGGEGVEGVDVAVGGLVGVAVDVAGE